MARLHCLRALAEEWPGAELVAQKESVEMGAHSQRYAVTYTQLADIVSR